MITNSCEETKLIFPIQCFQRRRRRSSRSGSFLVGSSVVLSGCPASRASFRFHQNEQRWFCQRQLIRTLCSQSRHKCKYKTSNTHTHVYKYKLCNTNTESSIISVCVFFRRQLIRTLWRLCGTLRRRSNNLFAEIGCLSNGESP